MSGDEAYFIAWGKHPDLGFYDHPPMVGWWLAPLLAISDAPWVVRLPALLLPAALALLARGALLAWFGATRVQAELAGVLLVLAPLSVWNVLITTDTPLTLFAFASLALFARAAQSGRGALYLASGACLGLAFLSKYFAVLLAVSYFAWAAFSPDVRGRWRGLGLVLLAALPFGLLNAWWNYEACWSNVMFNAVNRHEGADLSWRTPALFMASIAYLFAPFAWYAWKRPGACITELFEPERRALHFAWLVPLAVFALLSPVRTIGLHWLQSFVPALVLGAALFLERGELERCVRWFAVVAALHAAAAAAVAAIPLERWRPVRIYDGMVYLVETQQLLRSLGPLAERYALAADGYSSAAVLSYHTRSEVPVFGPGSSHARHDDILTDWRKFAGRDVMILRKEAPARVDYTPYFRSIELRTVELRGATFHVVLGNGFDYAAYRSQVLATVRDRWYRIPGWLPIGRCYLCERYFPGTPCGR
ncbi:MAG: glycosyltransferase family 39 protein [Betaproteobacteria bacterium]|nr:glycosyltransferase family 39 protein [Betaproteobacteria bacterium]